MTTPRSVLFSKLQGILEGVGPFHTQGNFEFFLKIFLTNFFWISALSAPIKKECRFLKKVVINHGRKRI